MQFVFRQIESADEPFLWEMLYYALYVPDGGIPFSREIVREPAIAQYVSGWGRASDYGFIVEDQLAGKPVGAVWLRQFSSSAPAYGFINDETPELSIACLPEYRNHGLGTQLMERVIATARGKHPALSLSVSRDNPVRGLYERFGFEWASICGDSLTMRKPLNRVDSLA